MVCQLHVTCHLATLLIARMTISYAIRVSSRRIILCVGVGHGVCVGGGGGGELQKMGALCMELNLAVLAIYFHAQPPN